MRAAVNRSYGPPDVLRIEDVDTPVPKEHEVLVKVHATTVNRTDCGFRAGKPFFVRLFSGLLKPKAMIGGSEFAGVVEAVGAGVTMFAVGDDVFGFNEWKFGAHAEYLVMEEDGSLASLPSGVAYEEAAPSTEGAHYALSYITKTKIHRGQHVLVNGGTGGIGSAAVQLLHDMGVTVTATCDTEHMEMVKGLGAARVVDYTVEDFTQDREIYDVVFDAVGKSTFGRCKRLLKPRGIYTSSELGPYMQNPFLALVTPLLRGRRVMFPIPPKHDRASTAHLADMIASGRFRPVIDRRYPLNQIAAAYAFVETGQKIGNVVIVVDPEGESSSRD